MAVLNLSIIPNNDICVQGNLILHKSKAVYDSLFSIMYSLEFVVNGVIRKILCTKSNACCILTALSLMLYIGKK